MFKNSFIPELILLKINSLISFVVNNEEVISIDLKNSLLISSIVTFFFKLGIQDIIELLIDKYLGSNNTLMILGENNPSNNKIIKDIGINNNIHAFSDNEDNSQGSPNYTHTPYNTYQEETNTQANNQEQRNNLQPLTPPHSPQEPVNDFEQTAPNSPQEPVNGSERTVPNNAEGSINYFQYGPPGTLNGEVERSEKYGNESEWKGDRLKPKISVLKTILEENKTLSPEKRLELENKVKDYEIEMRNHYTEALRYRLRAEHQRQIFEDYRTYFSNRNQNQ
jgi:hypothetical protein